MTQKRTAKQLDADIAASLARAKKKKPQGVVAQRAEQAKSERTRVKHVAEMMADLEGDDDWLEVDLDQLASWLDLGPSWSPTPYTTRELAEQLIEQSVQPQHAG